MGCGKSFTAEKLAEANDLEFFDLDVLIEEHTGKDIESIFSEQGEIRFRQIESEILLSTFKTGVYATGGGVIEVQKNIEFLQRKDNLVIWLNTNWYTIYDRIKNSNRPLLKNKTDKEIKELFNRRESKYRRTADLVITDQNITTLSNAIIDFMSIDN